MRKLIKIQRNIIPKKLMDKKRKVEKKKGVYHPKNVLNDLTGTEWIQETSTIWYQRGLGQGHKHAQIEKEHPAPFSYSMVERLVKFFTKKNGLVLDPFCGVASTLKACALNDRKGIGSPTGTANEVRSGSKRTDVGWPGQSGHRTKCGRRAPERYTMLSALAAASTRISNEANCDR